MKTDIKKIKIQNSSKQKSQTPKKDTIKKLASEPEMITTFVKEKLDTIKKNDFKSWVIPSFFSNKEINKHPVKIEAIIKDIQKHRKTNQLLSKKQARVDVDIPKSIPPHSNNNITSKKIAEIEIIPKIEESNNKNQKGGKIKTKKEGRLYNKQELKDLYTSLIQLYIDGNNSKITSVLSRLTKNQCNQILNYKKLIKKSWTNAPLPLLRFLVYQLISYPRLKYRIL
jgi:hypothetical protein